MSAGLHLLVIIAQIFVYAGLSSAYETYAEEVNIGYVSPFFCPPLKSRGVEVRCSLDGQEVSCSEYMKPKTKAIATCRQYYREIVKPENSSIVCLESGRWSQQLVSCVEECGLTTADNLLRLIWKRSSTHQGEFPWVAGVYRKDKASRWELLCGGVLISPHMVLTAAHCVVTENKVNAPGSFKVGLGKIFKDYYKSEPTAIMSDVRFVKVPPSYSGSTNFYALDIAILDLDASVYLNAYVMPACVDFSSSNTFVFGNEALVAGWGVPENATSIDKQVSVELTAIKNTDCIKKMSLNSKRLVTIDKFCAEIENGGQEDTLLSGAGLTYLVDGRHYLAGFASTKTKQNKNTSYLIFTNIQNTEHRVWLEKQKSELDQYHER